MKAEKKEKDAAEKKAAAAAKEQVDKKQKLIQEKAEQVFFKEVGDKLMDMPRVNVKDALLKDTSFNEPFVLTAENSVVSAWVADGTMVRVMSLYGSRYVKADCMKTEMKHTQPLQPSYGQGAHGRDVPETVGQCQGPDCRPFAHLSDMELYSMVVGMRREVQRLHVCPELLRHVQGCDLWLCPHLCHEDLSLAGDFVQAERRV